MDRDKGVEQERHRRSLLIRREELRRERGVPVESAAMGSKHFPASGGGKIADRRTQLKRLSRQSPRDQETERAFIEVGHATIRAELSSDPITSSDCA